MPTFSILMPNYNYRHYLPESVGSVIAQTFADFEAIVIDDRSTDASWDYITSIQDPRFSWYRNEENSGVSKTINKGLDHATGEYIVVLDPDDKYHPHFLKRQLEVLTTNPEIDICGTWVQQVDRHGNHISGQVMDWFNGDFDLNDPALWVWQNRLAHGAAVIRKSAHDLVGRFDEDLPITVDWNFWIRALAAGCRYHLIPEPLFESRQHGSNMTHSRPEKMVWSYAKTSAEHFHPYLFSIGREDLVTENMWSFLNHEVILESDLEVAGRVLTTLAGNPVQGRSLALGARSMARFRESRPPRPTPYGPAPDAPQLHLDDIHEAEEARSTYWMARAHGAEHELVVTREERDTLATQYRAAQKSLEILRARLPIRAAAYVNRQRIRVQQRRSDAKRQPEAAVEAIAASPSARPAVSVIIVSHNDGDALQRAIDSVVHQTMPDWELVIVDDGSDDAQTQAVLAGIDGPRVKKTMQEHRGLLSSRNWAAGQSEGDIMVFLDPRDSLEPTYLEKAVISFARYPGVDIVCPVVRSSPGGAEASQGFSERQLTYENVVPTSSAFRRRVWDAVGGIQQEYADGLEDWGFWRSAAGQGFHAWSLDEALVRRHSADPPKPEAVAGSDPGLVIQQLNPTVNRTARDLNEDAAAVREEISRRVFSLPPDDRQPLVVFMPWLLQGGGAPAFLHATLGSIRDEFQIVVITTNQIPSGNASAVNDFLDVTPYVYDLPSLVGPDALVEMMSSLLYRLGSPHMLLVGSPWVYANITAVRSMTRGKGRLIDVQFNHIGHLPKLLEIMPEVDLVLTASERLRTLLVDYYEVPKPVRVLYIAPPEIDDSMARPVGSPPRERLRIGWLGRNSPEKRPDLVATIAAAIPEADFVMAGSRLSQLPEQPDNVDVAGWVADPIEFLAGLDAILNTSDIEGISVTAMEALQLGVPVITRDVGGMAELVRDGENGLVYSEADIHLLARRLRDRDLVERVTAQTQAERLPAVFHFGQMVETVREAVTGG